MGKLLGGIYGRVHGKVGNLVHYQLRGTEIVRIAGKITTPPSDKQLACRQEMAVVVAFFRPMTAFVNMGFNIAADLVNKLPNNLAVSYNKKHALKGSYPDIAIDYTKAMLSQGSLPIAQNAAVIADGEVLKFSWSVAPNMDWAEKEHRCMLMAYFPLEERAVFCLSGARRMEGEDSMVIPADLQGAYMETYISFAEAGSNEVANSVYTGALNIPH